MSNKLIILCAMEDIIETPVWQDLQLGLNHDDIVIDSSEDNQILSAKLTSQAMYQLDVFSRNLDPRIYDNLEFIDAVRSIAVHNERATIRFLVIEPDFATKHGHRLIELARRLTSRIEIRKVHVDYAAYSECYLLADKRGVIYRKLASRYEAIVNFNNPSLASELGGHFNEVWDRSQPETNFKRLYI